MPDPVLIILHQEHSTPGRVGQALKHRGYALDIRRPRLGEPLPETMAHHSGAVLFGGPMSANDREDFIRREIDWLAARSFWSDSSAAGCISIPRVRSKSA